VLEIQVFLYLNILELSEDMYEDGYLNITNVDYSNTIVKVMEDRYKQRGEDIKCK
jgi:hypothetical protein